MKLNGWITHKQWDYKIKLCNFVKQIKLKENVDILVKDEDTENYISS